MTTDEIVLSTAYLPPVEYFYLIMTSGRVLIERNENYVKQTYRNRCIIAGPNGKQTLVIPVLHGNTSKSHIAATEIDYSKRWIPVHIGAIESSYRNSPYYDYYSDAIFMAISRKYRYLIDLNMDLLNTLTKYLSISSAIEFTTGYIKNCSKKEDFRYLLSPKSNSPVKGFNPEPYQQIFDERNGFFPNLSIIDLLFNTGPGSTVHILGQSSGIK